MYLYAVGESLAGPFKIGYAADVQKRVESLQIGNPRKLLLVCSVETKNYRRAERMAHHRAGWSNHIRGEWFSINGIAAKEAVLYGCEEAEHITDKRSRGDRQRAERKRARKLQPLVRAALEIVRGT